MRRGFHPITLLLGVTVCAVACSPDPRRAEERLREAGEIVVLTRVAPTTYYEDGDKTDGFEYALTQELGLELGITVRYKLYEFSELREALERGEGHIVAAGLARREEDNVKFLSGPTYLVVHQEVICRRDAPSPRTIAHLATRSILVPEDGNAEQHLTGLKSDHPELSWFATSDRSNEQIFEMVSNATVDCTVADSNVTDLLHPHYPELHVAFRLPGVQQMAWIVRSNEHDLHAFLDEWFLDREHERRLPVLRDRYFGGRAAFDYANLKVFLARIETRLPKYRALFVEAGEKHGIDWRLLAAQAYQESYWNFRAKSPTGVRGIMMLTLPTAREMGVVSRLDPAQSIRGGAGYFAKILHSIPEEIEQEDRIWFALAAYNVGRGHLEDARVLTERRGRDPNSWRDVQQSLPRLSQKEHYRDLAHGYARGSEPVKYVWRIRSYHAILERQFGG